MIALYGFGKLGKSLYKNLKNQDIVIDFILDKTKSDQRFDNKEIIHPENINILQRKETSVIISTYKQELSLNEFDKIKEFLYSLGYKKILNIQEAIIEYNIDFEYFYISNPNKYLINIDDKIEKVKNLFNDKISIDTFNYRLVFMKTGNILKLNQNIDNCIQYFPDFFVEYLQKRKENLRVVDCGACFGELLISMISKKLNILDYIAFEPDMRNSLILRKNILKNNINASIMNIGLSDKYEQCKFSSNGDMSSSISEDGDEIIAVNSIDNVIFGNIDFIKMDIEGFEMQALLGAKKSILTNKPALALSLYHKPLDFIEIPLFLSQFYKNFAIRQHSNHGFDLVLYVY